MRRLLIIPLTLSIFAAGQPLVASATSPVLVEGTFLGVQGKPIDALVTIVLNPKKWEAERRPIRFLRPTVATAAAGSDGRFAVPLTPSAALLTMADEAGVFNFILLARHGDLVLTRYFARRFDGTTWGSGSAQSFPSRLQIAPGAPGVSQLRPPTGTERTASPPPPGSPTGATDAVNSLIEQGLGAGQQALGGAVDKANNLLVTAGVLGEDESIDQPPIEVINSVVQTGGLNLTGCSVTKLDETISFTTIGELHADTDVVDYNMVYGTKADTDIGIGVSASATSTNEADWSFSAEGSENMGYSTGATQTFDHTEEKWGHRIETKFRYGKYYNYCSDPFGYYKEWYSIDPIEWIPYEQTGADISYKDQHCQEDGHQETNFGSGGRFDRSDSDYVTFKYAIKLVFGLTDVSTSQTGISTSTDLHWVFGPEPFHWLCSDSSALGIEASKRVYAGV